MEYLLNNNKYIENLKEYSSFPIKWEELNNKVIMITGATGLVGRFLIDLIMYKNINDGIDCKIVAIVRNKEKAELLFKDYLLDENFEILVNDVINEINYVKKVDYIINAASNTHPIQYATEPVSTITTNVLGTYNLLNFACQKNVKKFVFISSFEVYGNVINKKEISENDFGSVDCTVLRSCYPESKRLSESLCEAFSEEYKINTSIIRLSRVFGPTMNMESSLSTAQFLKNGLQKKDIVLKSDGTQMYSYNYVGDAVIAILIALLKGKDKEAYNVSDSKFDLSLKDFANVIASHCKTKIIFDTPNNVEKKGFSNSTMTILNSNKIKKLGWKVNKDVKKRIEETIDILNLQNE